jgi:hypothetical protein
MSNFFAGIVVLVLLAMIVVIFLGAFGVFYTYTDDGALVVEWREITPPHDGLQCWAAYGDDWSVYCEER